MYKKWNNLQSYANTGVVKCHIGNYNPKIELSAIQLKTNYLVNWFISLNILFKENNS